MGMERTPRKESAQKVNSDEENSPASAAGNGTRSFSITSPVLYQQASKKQYKREARRFWPGKERLELRHGCSNRGGPKPTFHREWRQEVAWRRARIEVKHAKVPETHDLYLCANHTTDTNCTTPTENWEDDTDESQLGRRCVTDTCVSCGQCTGCSMRKTTTTKKQTNNNNSHCNHVIRVWLQHSTTKRQCSVWKRKSSSKFHRKMPSSSFCSK